MAKALNDLKREYYLLNAPGALVTDTLADLEYKYFSAGGGGGIGALPLYEFQKKKDTNGIQDLWVPVMTLGPIDMPAGTFEAGFSISWIGTDETSGLIIRDRVNAGTWSTYAQKSDSIVYWRSFFFQYPVIKDTAGSYTIEMEAKREGLGVIDIKYADMWVRQAKV